MESMREWVLLLSGTALLSAAVGALVPPGARQAFRVLCALAVLYAVLLPLRGLSLNRLDLESLLQPQAQTKEMLDARAEDAALLAANATLRREMEAALQQAGQTQLSVEVRCARFEDGIAPAQIILRGAGDKAAAAAALQPFLTSHTEWTLLTEETDDG